MTSEKLRLRSVVPTVLLLAFSFLVVFPFLWMVSMSLRSNMDILRDPFGLPRSLNLSNYAKLLSDPQIRYLRYYANSLIVTLGGIALTLGLAALAGYGFGRRRYRFRHRETVFSLLLLSMMIPVQATYLPQFEIMSRYGILNTRLSLVLLYAAQQLTISTFLMKSYFQQMPEELEESARMDGAGDFRTFLSIMLPLTRPVVVSVVILNFLHNWNELLLSMTMVTRPDLRTLPVAMMNFVGEMGANYAMAAASLVLGVLPVLAVYAAFSDKFVKGLTAGAVKG